MIFHKYNHAWEKFYGAVRLLVSAGSQRERLVGAFIEYLSHLRIEELPPDLTKDFSELKSTVTQVAPIGEEGVITATIRAMTDLQVSETVDKIVALYDSVVRADERLPDHDD